MRILSLTAGAASMYCGSCLRDNALATELIARGHDVTLLPGLHADADRRAQRQPAAACSSAASASTCSSTCRSSATRRAGSTGCGTRRGSSASCRGASIQADGRFLGEHDRLDAEGRARPSAQGARQADRLAARRSRRRTSSILPFALLIGLAGPIREALGAQIVCTLQGEDLFLEQLRRAVARAKRWS